MGVRAKFRLDEVHHYAGPRKQYVFRAVCDDQTPENRRFQKYTPSGDLKMMVDNPAVGFEPGKSYYLDFTPAD